MIPAPVTAAFDEPLNRELRPSRLVLPLIDERPEQPATANAAATTTA